MGSAYNRVIETRKELTKQLLAEMEQGELPWMKGWKTTGTRPYNPVTKAVYKGNNRLRLMLASHFGQFQDNRWVTFNLLMHLHKLLPHRSHPGISMHYHNLL